MPVPSLLDHGRPINFTTSFAARSLAMRAQASSASARRVTEELEPMQFRRGFSLDDDDESDRMDDVSESRATSPPSFIPNILRAGPPLLEMHRQSL